MNPIPQAPAKDDLEIRKSEARAEMETRPQGDLFLDDEINEAETLDVIDGLMSARKRRRPRVSRSAAATDTLQMVMDLEKVPATDLDNEDSAPEPSEDVADHHQHLSIGAVVIQGSSQCRSSPFNRIPYRQWRVPPHSNPQLKSISERDGNRDRWMAIAGIPSVITAHRAELVLERQQCAVHR